VEFLVILFGFVCGADAGKIVARTDALAQASLSHLGEISRNIPMFILELSLRRRALVLSKVTSHLGERGSPKREPVGT